MDKIVQFDTRQQKDTHIEKWFKSRGWHIIRSKMYVGDYCLPWKRDIVVEYKKDLLELGGNLCSGDHKRFVREIERSKAYGFKRFAIVVIDEKIAMVEDVKDWGVPTRYNQATKEHYPLTLLKPETLMKTMMTMEKKYGVEFYIVKKVDAGAVIETLLTMEETNEES